MADLANLRIAVDSRDVKSATTDLNQLDKAASATEKSADRLGKSFGSLKGILVGIGFAFVTKELVSIANEAMKANEAIAQLQVGLTTMGGAAGRSVEELKNAAQQLANISNFSRTDILGGVTTQLITFGNVSGKVFDRAQELALDLSVRLGQDLQSSAIQLGKALNDPLQGLTALGRVGISFNESQKQTIKEMVKVGDVASAQGIILDELAKQYGGSAKAQRDAAPGGDVIQAWTELREAIGQGLIPVLQFLEKIAAPVLSAITQNLGTLVVTALAAAAAFAAVQASMAVGAVRSYIGSLIALERALGATNTRMALFGVVSKAAQAAMMQLTAVMMVNPFVAVATAIAGLSALLYANRDAQVEVGGEVVRLGDIFTGIFELIKQAVSFAATVFRDGWAAAFATVAPGLVNVGKAFDRVLKVVTSIIRGYVNSMIGLFAGLGSAISAAINLEDPIAAFKQSFGKDYVGAIADGASRAIVNLANIGKEASASAAEVKSASSVAAGGLGEVETAAGKAGKEAGKLARQMAELYKKTEDFIQALRTEIEEIGKTDKQLRALQVARALDIAQTQKQIDTIKELSEERERLLEIQEAAAAAEKNLAEIEKAERDTAEAVKDIEKRNKELRHQIALIRLSGDARKEAIRAFEDEAFAAEMNADGIIRGNEALEEYLRLRRELAQGESAFDKEVAETERLARNLETAASMFGQGRLGSVLQGVLNLEVKFKDGEIRKISDALAKEFPKLSGIIANAVAGAQMGQQVGGLMSALGIKSSNAGAQIGGAIGMQFGGPIGAIGGSIVGGLIGGMLKKTPRAAATVEIAGGDALMAGVTGSSKLRGVATGLANGLLKGLTDVADQLGGALGGAVSLSIGQRKDKFTVDVTGRGRTKGVPTFATEAEAIAYAMRHAIGQGAITGISAGAQALIRGSGDLNEQLRKALTFENVFKELAREKDPLTFALDELGRELAKLEGLFREAGAGAAEYAQLQELFAIRRQRAIFEAERPAREKEIELLEVQGRTVEALAAKRRLELDSMDASLRGIQKLIYAYEDLNAANDRVSVAEARLAEAQRAQRQQQIAAMQNEISKLDEVIARREAAQNALRQAYSAEVARIDSEIRQRETNINSLRSAFAQQEQVFRGTIDQFRSFADSVREFGKTILPMNGTGRASLAALRRRFAEVAALALSGDESARGEFSNVGKQLRDAIIANATDRVSMMRGLLALQAQTEEVAVGAEAQATIAEQQLDEASRQNEILVAIEQRAIEQLNAQKEATTALVSQFIDLNGTALSVDEAIRQLQTAEVAAKEAEAQKALLQAQIEALQAVDQSVISLEEAERELENAVAERDRLLREINQNGFISVVNATNASADRIVSAVASSKAAAAATARAAIVPDWTKAIAYTGGVGGGGGGGGSFDLFGSNVSFFANGGMHSGGLRIVGENGPELEATGPSRIYNANQLGNMMGGGSAADEVKALREEMRLAMYQIAKNTGKSYDLLDRWNGDGLPPERVF